MYLRARLQRSWSDLTLYCCDPTVRKPQSFGGTGAGARAGVRASRATAMSRARLIWTPYRARFGVAARCQTHAPPGPDPAPLRRYRGARRRHARLHGRLQGRAARRAVRRPRLPGGGDGAGLRAVRRRTRSASSSTSTASSTWRRSTRAGSASRRSRTSTARTRSAPGGRDIQVVKLTDHSVPDEGKETLLYSLSVHGNERGGLEGGLRTAEDLAIAAENGGKLADGVDNYDSSTGRKEVFHELEVKDLLAKEAVYFVDFNPDGWAIGDLFATPTQPYSRTNANGTDLNRQMPTIGRINPTRNPLEEPEAAGGVKFMQDVAAAGRGGRMAYGADIHGELNSQAYMDVMYPAGEFDSVDHRRLMAIAERTKSVIDATLYQGIIEEIENASGGNDAEYARGIPVKPAHWATVWDSLGYTDTGFIGDYMATDLGVTGMDYEIFLNHTVPDKSLERLPAGEPHQRQPRDHQDGDGVRAVPARGVQPQERRRGPGGPRRLPRQPGHRDRHGRERAGHAARARTGTAWGRTGSRSPRRRTRCRT